MRSCAQRRPRAQSWLPRCDAVARLSAFLVVVSLRTGTALDELALAWIDLLQFADLRADQFDVVPPV